MTQAPLRSQSSSSLMIQVFVILAVAMGIASVLVVSVIQRSREIGTLRAMGTPRARVLRIFLIQGGIVGVLGAAIGSVMGGGRTLGLIFQFHHLIMALSAIENVMMPLATRTGWMRKAMRGQALAALADVGLADRADDSPRRRLSGGQQQRVAIARALVTSPPLILADEPTGSLDSTTASEVFTLMRAANRDKGVAFLMVTHDRELASRCDRIIELVDGRIAREK